MDAARVRARRVARAVFAQETHQRAAPAPQPTPARRGATTLRWLARTPSRALRDLSDCAVGAALVAVVAAGGSASTPLRCGLAGLLASAWLLQRAAAPPRREGARAAAADDDDDDDDECDEAADEEDEERAAPVQLRSLVLQQLCVPVAWAAVLTLGCAWAPAALGLASGGACAAAVLRLRHPPVWPPKAAAAAAAAGTTPAPAQPPPWWRLSARDAATLARTLGPSALLTVAHALSPLHQLVTGRAAVLLHASTAAATVLPVLTAHHVLAGSTRRWRALVRLLRLAPAGVTASVEDEFALAFAAAVGKAASRGYGGGGGGAGVWTAALLGGGGGDGGGGGGGQDDGEVAATSAPAPLDLSQPASAAPSYKVAVAWAASLACVAAAHLALRAAGQLEPPPALAPLPWLAALHVVASTLHLAVLAQQVQNAVAVTGAPIASGSNKRVDD